ncbi:hypothetical protein [Desulfobotulus mexicanus]|uniref:Uncharacterized protein n=1 Tax=Desulfobotulus mexicanus TaxID=2586642 RepID=A0A5S5MC75_9BACT|nr:hypothetical protein [Desulfobotulus mexicanus]TYT73259.1 hypothetical protein FIM25_16095 [Desulfobotulus mexicanus]
MALERWAIPEFPVFEEEYPLVTAPSDKQTLALSFFVSNYSDTASARIDFFHRDGGGNLLFRWAITLAETDSPFALDTIFVLAPGDSLSAASSLKDVAVLVSGDLS